MDCSIGSSHYYTRMRASQLLNNEINKGLIKRPDICSHCGKNKKEQGSGLLNLCGHHHDYDKPLDVIWLCHSCHVKLHNKQRTRCK